MLSPRMTGLTPLSAVNYAFPTFDTRHRMASNEEINYRNYNQKSKGPFYPDGVTAKKSSILEVNLKRPVLSMGRQRRKKQSRNDSPFKSQDESRNWDKSLFLPKQMKSLHDE